MLKALGCALSEYQSDGVTVCRGVLSSSTVQKIKCEIEALLLQPSGLATVHRDAQDPGGFVIDMLLHRRSALVRQVALDSAISALAQHFLPTGAAYFFYDQLFVKEPFTTTRTQWHQDLAYWPLVGTEIPSLWLALTDCHEKTSSVQYVRGSHRGPSYIATNHETRDLDKAAGLNICPDYHLENLQRGDTIIRNSLEAGDVVIHHPLVVHGAGPNSGASRRMGLSFRYCAGTVRWNRRLRTMFFPGTEHIANGTSFLEQDVFPQLQTRKGNHGRPKGNSRASQ